MKLIQSVFQLTPDPSLKNPVVAFWFAVSFIAPLYFGLISLLHTASSRYIVQDDARLHIVWLQRLTDPELFSEDIIADYFGIIQPVGFKLLYRLAAAAGMEALTLAKILPLVLAVIATAYLFWVALRILPVPMSGVLATILLNQNIWIRDDLISAAPRAFIYPIFSAFLYYLLKDAKLGSFIALAGLGLFYPQMMLIAVGLLTLRLVKWQGVKPHLSRRFQDYIFWLIALVMTLAMLMTFSHQVAAQVGDLASLDEMKALPEFQLGGRGEYFGVPFLSFWFDGSSGLRFPLFPPIILLGFLLPLVDWQVSAARIKLLAFSLAPQVTSEVRVIYQLLISAIALFLIAHLIFPALYLPSRYTFYSSRFVLILASSVMLTLVGQGWGAWIMRQKRRVSDWNWLDFATVELSLALAIAILITPAIPFLFLGGQGWVIGQPASVFEHIAQSPKDSLVASLVTDINDNVPAFSERSILVGREFALPFHPKFYAQMQQRAEDLVRSQYTPDPAVLRSFIETYGLDIWIIDRDFTNPAYLNQQPWLVNSSMQKTVTAVQTQLQRGIQPVISRAIAECLTFEAANLVVLDAPCLVQETDDYKTEMPAAQDS